MIDRDVIEAKFDIIEKNLKFLNEYKTKETSEIEKDYRDMQAIKYSLFEVTEACIDIANHIIAVKGFERAEEYSKMFLILSENEVISKELGKELAKMAKFRNLLIHRYVEVDVEKLLEIIKFHLKDVIEFIKRIKVYIKS